MKRVCVFLITICMLAFFLIGCQNPIIYARLPLNFPGSKWETGSGEISFVVESIYLPLPQLAGKHGYGDNPTIWFFAQGEVNINGEKIGVYFDSCPGSNDICIFSKEIEELTETTTEYPFREEEAAKYVIAWFDCDYKSKKRFVAVVTESEYFEIGEKFLFKRVS